jgi:hypothetical protein
VECDSEHIDLTYCTADGWVTCGKALSRVFQLRNEIDTFLTDSERKQETRKEGDYWEEQDIGGRKIRRTFLEM